LPLVSVGVPVYNGENYIGDCIDSILRQTEEDFELIVVDNNSTDHTYDIVSGYKDPRIKVFKNKKNIGSIANFNRCIELAQGDYFVLLPHDDVLLSTMLDTFSKVFVSDPKIGFVYSSYFLINEYGDQIDHRVVAPEDKVMSSEEALQEFILHGNPIQCAMVRRQLFTSLGSFNSDFLVLTDVDMWCRIVLDGNKAAYLKTPQNCLRVRLDSGQQSFSHSNKENLGIIADHLGFVPDKNFIRDNSLYIQSFRYLEMLFEKIPEDSDLQKLRPLAAKQWILGSLIKNLAIFTARGSWSYARKEVHLLTKVIRWAGFWGMVPVLSSMPFEFIRRVMKRLR
jgi:glycosyltransferase involved in cell wall biosynthesis